MNRGFSLVFLSIVIIIAVLSLCTAIVSNNNVSTGGTGSEVVGVVNYPNSGETAKRQSGAVVSSSPLINGNVFINPIDHLADTGSADEEAITVTDDNGYFSIKNVLPGEHIIYIRDDDGKAIAHHFTVSEGEEQKNLGLLYARKTAGVSVEYTGSTPGNVLFFLDVEGTDLQVKCSGGKLSATLDHIPIGTSYTIVVRMYRPVVKGYRFPTIELSPGVTRALEAITGE